jgi:hypothetical protein
MLRTGDGRGTGGKMKDQLVWQRKVIRDEYLDDDRFDLGLKAIFRKRRATAKKLLSAATPSNRTLNTSK